MHEGVKSITDLICDHLSDGFDLKFLSQDRYQVEDEGHKTVTYIEDEEGNRYTLTLAVAKKARVETEMGMTRNEVEKAIEEGRPHPGRDIFDLAAHPVPTLLERFEYYNTD